MTCKDCIHEKVCDALIKSGCPYLDEEVPADVFCMEFRNTADVAPRAEWISVEERLPDENGRFLTVDKKGDMMVCFWEKHFGWFAMVCNKNAITHWMPLPEPPDMKGGE